MTDFSMLFDGTAISAKIRKEIDNQYLQYCSLFDGQWHHLTSDFINGFVRDRVVERCVKQITGTTIDYYYRLSGDVLAPIRETQKLMRYLDLIGLETLND